MALQCDKKYLSQYVYYSSDVLIGYTLEEIKWNYILLRFKSPINIRLSSNPECGFGFFRILNNLNKDKLSAFHETRFMCHSLYATVWADETNLSDAYVANIVMIGKVEWWDLFFGNDIWVSCTKNMDFGLKILFFNFRQFVYRKGGDNF